MQERERFLLFEVLEFLRKIIQKDFYDWKDADDWLFSNLSIDKHELEEIYNKTGVMVYNGSCAD